jgi:hypothetical protein
MGIVNDWLLMKVFAHHQPNMGTSPANSGENERLA